MKQKKIKIFTAVMAMTMMMTMGCGISGNTVTQNSSSKTGNDIGQDEAKKIAFEDAGVEEADATRLKIERDQDDGMLQYDVKFSVAEKEYDYEINGTDGTIISADVETERSGGNTAKDQTNSSSSGNTENTTGSNVAVSEEDAKAAALARVEGAAETDIRMELEFDDGYYVYEGDIIYQQKEYEFEIDAQTGNFLKWSEERY